MIQETRGGDFFRFDERDELMAGDILDVLGGRKAGFVVRGFADKELCRRDLDAFSTSALTRERDGDAVGRYLGAYHWGRTHAEYLAEAAPVREAVTQFVAKSQWARLWDGVTLSLARQSVIARPARWAGQDVVVPLIRSWSGAGEYSLVPHDDAAQLTDPRQAGFEGQRITGAACSLNLCLANAAGGELVLWDLLADYALRAEHGTEYTGGPYPPSAYADRASLHIVLGPGDAYMFNGGLLHAVAQTMTPRATVACLLGQLDPATVVTWA